MTRKISTAGSVHDLERKNVTLRLQLLKLERKFEALRKEFDRVKTSVATRDRA